MGYFRSFVSAQKVREYLRGKSQFTSRVLAILLGSITPFCSCSSVPLFIGFIEAGIPIGTTFSFLIASPIINEVAVVLLFSIVGLKITIMYIASAFLVAFVGGLVIDKLNMRKYIESYVWDIKVGNSQCEVLNTSLLGRHNYAISQVKEILGRIYKWIFLGIFLGAFFHGYFPEDMISDLNNLSSIFEVPLSVLIGIPLYSNASGIIPLAEAMLTKGVAVGTTLAFMISVSAVSLPEMIILKQVIRWQGLLLFSLIVSVGIMLIGLFLNFII
jgi:uncharacterized membrane protein YraQ (UPF0718 family)